MTALVSPASLTVDEQYRVEFWRESGRRPAQKLHIAGLAKQFAVSLAAVREALSRLVADGLVQASDQRGFRVSPVSAADLRDVTQTRVDIEGLALRRSIEHGIRLGSLRWSELLQRSEKARNVQAEHAAIVHAVLKRDADAAVVALSKHFLMTMHLVELATPKPPHSAASNDLHPLCQQPGRL